MKYTDIPYFFVFDVESVGLHGEAFSVGYVVVSTSGEELEAAVFSEDANHKFGTRDGHGWVQGNVGNLKLLPPEYAIHDLFWDSWIRNRMRGVISMAADVPWPVETNFLSECVHRQHDFRERTAPYPLIDVASVLLAKGYDDTATYRRLESELPEHNPLADARQSARLLTMALRGDNLTFHP